MTDARRTEAWRSPAPAQLKPQLRWSSLLPFPAARLPRPTQGCTVAQRSAARSLACRKLKEAMVATPRLEQMTASVGVPYLLRAVQGRGGGWQPKHAEASARHAGALKSRRFLGPAESLGKPTRLSSPLRSPTSSKLPPGPLAPARTLPSPRSSPALVEGGGDEAALRHALQLVRVAAHLGLRRVARVQGRRWNTRQMCGCYMHLLPAWPDGSQECQNPCTGRGESTSTMSPA